MVSAAVIMATHNGMEYIEAQIGSIRAQIDCETSIYFSDDASSDQTYEFCQSTIGANYDLNSDRNQYGSAAVNFFNAILNFKESKKYDVILLCDQDDIWLPRKIKRAYKYVNERYDIYSGSFWSMSSMKTNLTYVNKKFVQRENSNLVRGPGPGFTFAFSAEAFDNIRNEIKLLFERDDFLHSFPRWHDWFLYALAMSKGLKWFIDDEAHALYRQHDSNDTGVNLGLNAAFKRFSMLRNGDFHDEICKIISFCGLIENKFSKRIVRFNFFDRLFCVPELLRLRPSLHGWIGMLFFICFSKKGSFWITIREN